MRTHHKKSALKRLHYSFACAILNKLFKFYRGFPLQGETMSLSFMSVPDWVSASFPIIRLVMIVLMVLIALFLVVVILFQPSSASGMGALTGSRDTFYSKDKSKSLESVMKRLTVILGIVEGVLAILFFVSLLIYRAGM